MASMSICSLRIAAPVRSLGAVSGELVGAGAQQAFGSSPSSSSSSGAAAPLLVQPVAKRVCDLTGKKANNGYRVSFSNHRTKHLQGANLQYKRLWWEEANRFVKLRISTRALKTIEKKGLSVMAKEAGIDLNDYAVSCNASEKIQMDTHKYINSFEQMKTLQRANQGVSKASL